VAAVEELPEDVDALKAALRAERGEATRLEAELAATKAKASDDQALSAHSDWTSRS
jgi:transposase